ncbi:MAG: radical SAM protein [Candidatus Parabeggiatoa sp.]|nr:radical SAM protein [Candidatus Parabeggiatoa sp.]
MKNQNVHRQMETLKTLLVNPPFQRFASDSFISAHHFPVGLGYIAGALEQAEYPVEIYDADLFSKPIYNTEIAHFRIAAHRPDHVNALLNFEHEVWHEVEALFREKAPDIVGITTKSVILPSAYMVAKIAKKVNKDVVIVFGGSGATTVTEQVLQDHPVDFVVRGEGEQTMTELVAMLHSSKPDFYKIEGLSFKNGGRIINNKNRAVVKDIDTLPYPAKHLLLYADQLPDILYKTIHGDIITSRGCPYACTFCAANVVWGGRSVRMRSAEEVVKEILHQKERYGVQNFMLWDDLFTIKRKRVVEICNLLIAKKVNVNWICYIRVDNIDIELLALMKQAGCVRVEVGVESGSNRVLKEMHKGITVEQTQKAAEMLNEVGLPWTALLMIGVPGETKEEMAATMGLLPKLSPTKVVFGVFSPYPGTPLHTKLKAEGRLNDNDPLDVNHYYADTMSKDEFRDLFLSYSKQVDEYNNKMKYGHTDSPVRQLVTIGAPLAAIVDIDPYQFQMAHWGIEYYDGKILLWLGHGQAEGITGVLWVTETGQVQLSFTVEPGPGRKDRLRTVELRFENETRSTTKGWQFDQKTNLIFKITLQPGSNKFSLLCPDKATIFEQPGGDTRSLLVLLHRITVQPDAGTPLHAKLKGEGRLNENDPLEMKYDHTDSLIRQLVTISTPLATIVDIKPHQFQMAHWGIEYYDGKILLWLGHGQAEGITGVFQTTETCQVQLSFTIEPGPGRKDRLRTVELRFENETRSTTKGWQFDQKINLIFKITLQPGSNKFSLLCPDKATILEQPNGDTRPLLVLLHKITVQPDD